MHNYSSYSDWELSGLLKQGDGPAFAEIYDRYWAVLYRHALRMLQDEKIAEDTLQDVFLNLWDKAADITFTTNLSGYLYTAVRNRVLDHWSHNKVKEKYIGAFGSFMDQGRCETDFLIREKELRQLIEIEISALPENLRASFELSRKANMSYKEIAEKLDISEHAVRNNVSRALKLLRTRFGDLAVVCFLLSMK